MSKDRSLIDEIKRKVTLKQVMDKFGGAELHGDGDKLEGWHKAHESTSKRSLHVDNAAGIWHCKNCGQGGDVFTWVGHSLHNGTYRDSNKAMFAEAMRAVADYAGVVIPDRDAAGTAERRTIEEIWQIAADFYQGELTDDHKEYFRNRGYFDETISKYKLGYAPLGPRTLLTYLTKKHKIDTDDLLKSGLFLKRDNDTIEDHFQGRLMFPYINGGRVTYFIGRETKDSPQWEQDKKMKYKKLRVHNADNPYVSEQVNNRYFYGEDSVKPGADLLITEGVADALSALQAGFNCVSPVTIRFAKKDWPRLLELAQRSGTVYICNDNEQNNSGNEGTLATAQMLWKQGKVARLVTLPRPAGVSKVDLNDFLNNPEQGPEAFKKLLPTAKTLLDLQVEKIATCKDDEERITLQKDIIAIIAQVADPFRLALWARSMPEKLKMGKRAYDSAVKRAKQEQEAQSAVKEDTETADDSELRGNIATVLYELAMDNCESFTGSDGISYVSVVVEDKDGNSHIEIMKVKSMRFRQWLGQLHYKSYNSIVGKTACEEVIELLSFQSDDTRQIFLRVGQKDGSIYIDLGNEKWQCVEVNAKGWQVLDVAPVNFRRTAKMKALPMPEKSTDINVALLDLWSLINVAQEDRILILVWLLAAMRAQGPYPIIALLAEAGSAKTTTAKALKRLISPYVAETRSRPKTVEDVYVAANNDWVLIYDNLSSIPQDISDAFCRLSTGGGYATRELYENLEEIATDQQRPLIINGISDIVKKGDLMSRVLTITCPEIAPDRRIDESTWDRRFAEAQPRIMGALYELLSAALDNLPNAKLSELPRMADFARLGVALDIATELVGSPESFLNRYSESVSQGSITVIEMSPIYRPLHRFLQGAKEWEGTASELLEAIRPHATTLEQFYLPKAGNHLSAALSEISPNLRLAKIIDCRISRNKRGRRIAVTPMSKFNEYAPTDDFHDSEKG